MRLCLALAAMVSIQVGCASKPAWTDASCTTIGELAADQKVNLRGELYVDQHGDFIRLAGCSSRSLRVHGIQTASGVEAATLRKEIGDTLALFEVYWDVEVTVRAERDNEGQIFRILSVQSAKRIGARPNSSFKPTPLRGAA